MKRNIIVLATAVIFLFVSIMFAPNIIGGTTPAQASGKERVMKKQTIRNSGKTFLAKIKIYGVKEGGTWRLTKLKVKSRCLNSLNLFNRKELFWGGGGFINNRWKTFRLDGDLGKTTYVKKASNISLKAIFCK